MEKEILEHGYTIKGEVVGVYFENRFWVSHNQHLVRGTGKLKLSVPENKGQTKLKRYEEEKREKSIK